MSVSSGTAQARHERGIAGAQHLGVHDGELRLRAPGADHRTQAEAQRCRALLRCR